jgi:hypothetical protein
MNPLILDSLKRRWLICVFFCLLHFGLGWTIIPDWSIADVFVPTALFLGPNILLLDLQRGYPRAALSLPFTAKQIGRTFWWFSVGLPFIALSAFSFLGTIFSNVMFGYLGKAPAHGFEIPVLKWLFYVTTNGFMLGAMFWLFCASPNVPTFGWQSNIRQWFKRLLSIGLFIGCIFCLIDRQRTELTLAFFYITAITMSVLGWLQAESMVAEYGQRRAASQQAANARRQSAPPPGFGGILFSFVNSFSKIWSTGILMLVFMNLVDVFEKRPLDWHHLTKNLANGGAFFPFLFVFLAFSPTAFLNLRHLRTLPLSTWRLVAFIFFEAILPLLTLCLALTLLAWHESGSAECLSYFKIEFLFAASTSIFIAVAIWNVHASFLKGVVLAILILTSLAPTVYEMSWGVGTPNTLPVWFVAAFTIGLFALSFFATCRIISSSSSPYRPRLNQSGNRWNWGN